MAHRKGEIILVPFPFTDLSTQKTRPAMVLSDGAFEQSVGSIVVAMITSVPHATPFDYALADWKLARLLYPSWVRMKLATLDLSLVVRSVGHVSDRDLRGVDIRLKRLFRL